MHEGHPFPRGRIGFAVAGWSPGLRALPAAPSRRLLVASGLSAAGFPDHSGGSAPVSHRLPITVDLERADRSVIRAPSVLDFVPPADDRQPPPPLHPAR